MKHVMFIDGKIKMVFVLKMMHKFNSILDA